MKVLNVYLTKIYSYMEAQGYFHDNSRIEDESFRSFVSFAELLGYPEFGLSEGMKNRDFSYLPDTDFINYSDLKEEIFRIIPLDVIQFIKKELPDFYHQVSISLAMKSFAKDSHDEILNELNKYFTFFKNKQNPKQGEYEFINYVIDFLSEPSKFNILVKSILGNKDGTLWELFLHSLLSFNDDSEKIKKFSARLIISTSSLEYKDFLVKKIIQTNWDKILSPKFLKNINPNSESFIEVSSSGVYLSVKGTDLNHLKVLKILEDLTTRLKVVFPEIDGVYLDKDTFFNRIIFHIVHSSMDELKKRSLNSFFSALLNLEAQNLSIDYLNEKILKPIEVVIMISSRLDSNNINDWNSDLNGDVSIKI